MSWRTRAAYRVATTIGEAPMAVLADPKALLKYVSDRYPFYERRGFAYKAWLLVVDEWRKFLERIDGDLMVARDAIMDGRTFEGEGLVIAVYRDNGAGHVFVNRTRPRPNHEEETMIRLEIFSQSSPRTMHATGLVEAVPNVGDFLQTAITNEGGDSSWFGYVQSRRWTFDGNGLESVRVWIHADKPR